MAANQDHIALGRAGEDAAAAYLSRQGWKLLARNWRPPGPARGLELDIVARDGDMLVFVEVKSRSASAGPAAAPAPTGAAQDDATPKPGRAASPTPDRMPLTASVHTALTVPVHTALTAQKKTRLVKAASRYLTAKGAWRLPCRFDLICIEYGADSSASLEHFTNVIELGHLVDRGHAAWQP